MLPEDFAIFLGLVTILIHFFSDRLATKGKYLSFAAGISVTYIFLYMFPEALGPPVNSGVFVLLGFAALRIMEVHIHRHRSIDVMKRELKELHAAVFFIYHFFVGVVLLNIVRTNMLGGLLFFFPLIFHSTISSAALPELHEKIKGIASFRFFLSLSTVIGVIASMAVPIPEIIDFMSMGFITGALLYIVIRDSMPKDTKSSPKYFVLGVLLYVVLITLTAIFK